jgi:hypothetical protein
MPSKAVISARSSGSGLEWPLELHWRAACGDELIGRNCPSGGGAAPILVMIKEFWHGGGGAMARCDGSE